jgi:hypothetical protein
MGFGIVTGFAKKLASATGAWSKNIVASVFSKDGEAKLTDKNVREIDKALRSDTKPHLCETRRWNSSETLDLTETSKLPKGFSCPNNLKTIKLHARQRDLSISLLENKDLKGSLPKKDTVTVQYVISKKEIFDILQNNPENLTEKMAIALIDDGTTSAKGLSSGQVLTALQRMEEKFDGQKLPSVEARNILIAKLVKDDKYASAVAKYSKVLQGIKFENLVPERVSETNQQERTSTAIKQEMNKLTAQLKKAGVAETEIETIAANIFNESKSLIKRNAKEPISRQGLLTTVQNSYATVLPNDSHLDHKVIMDIALHSLKRLETMYENGHNTLSQGYKRMTKFNATKDQDEKLVFAQGITTKYSKARTQEALEPSIAYLLGLRAQTAY